MTTDAAQPKKSPAAAIFSTIAIIMGLYTFLQAGLRGHSAGWEMLAPFAGVAVVSAVIAIAMRRRPLTYVAVGFGLLGVAGFFLGA